MGVGAGAKRKSRLLLCSLTAVGIPSAVPCCPLVDQRLILLAPNTASSLGWVSQAPTERESVVLSNAIGYNLQN